MAPITAVKLLHAVLLWVSAANGLEELQTLLSGLKLILAAVGGGPSRQCIILMMQTLVRAVKLAESGVSRASWPSSPEELEAVPWVTIANTQRTPLSSLASSAVLPPAMIDNIYFTAGAIFVWYQLLSENPESNTSEEVEMILEDLVHTLMDVKFILTRCPERWGLETAEQREAPSKKK